MPRKKVSRVVEDVVVKTPLKKQFDEEAEEVRLRFESFLQRGFSTEQAFDLTVLYMTARFGGVV